MAKVAEDTAYYFNGKIPALVLIAKGVRFPSGNWVRVAHAAAAARGLEDMLRDVFPALKGKTVMTDALMNEFDVEEFERSTMSEPT